MPKWHSYLFALLAPCIIKLGFEIAASFVTLKRLSAHISYLRLHSNPRRRDSGLLTSIFFLLFSSCHKGLLQMLFTRLYKWDWVFTLPRTSLYCSCFCWTFSWERLGTSKRQRSFCMLYQMLHHVRSNSVLV